MPSQEQVNRLIEERGRLLRQRAQLVGAAPSAEHPGMLCREVQVAIDATGLVIRLARHAGNTEILVAAQRSAVMLTEAHGSAHVECMEIRRGENP
jgi:hypothetical protein